MNEALNAASALMERAKRVCEACFLGIATEGVTTGVNPNVQGVGIGNKVVHRIPTKEKVLQVYVGRKIYGSLVPKDLRIPNEIEGIPTDVVETGIFQIGKKFPPIYQRRVRPAPAGVSVGHKDISAGTFGALVREGSDTYILSNNHVLANENLGKVGDNIVQPGPYDGGRPDRDTIAQLAGFVPLKTDEANLVDAAIATPIVREEVAPEILNIGRAKGDAEPEVDLFVRKTGRTTRYTEGHITATDVTLRVGYSNGSLVFTDQFLVSGTRGKFSDGGDSGSLIVDKDNHAVGLLFAGSPFTTVANRWSNVAKALRVKPIS